MPLLADGEAVIKLNPQLLLETWASTRAENPFFRDGDKIKMRCNGLRLDFDKGRLLLLWQGICVGEIEVSRAGLKGTAAIELTDIEVLTEVKFQ